MITIFANQHQDVNRFAFPLLLCALFCQSLTAQTKGDSAVHPVDTTVLKQKPAIIKDTLSGNQIKLADSLLVANDSLGRVSKGAPVKTLIPTPDALTLFTSVLKNNPWFNFFGRPKYYFIERRVSDSNEGLFYLLTGLILYFALLKLFFTKYLGNLLSLFLRASLRQQQIREQLLQTPLPSLLLNILFVITGGLYVCFLIRYYQPGIQINFWLLLTDCSALVGFIYLSKFVLLKMAGWVFNIEKATDTYIFIVYMVNKILGIVLLAFLIILFYSVSPIREIALTISFCFIGFLFLYRFTASYPSVRHEIKISIFYFFLYLCAFEIAPLLLIYKVLFTYLGKAY